jgi:hypothetical protein
MNWYKNQLDKIAEDCLRQNIPSSAKIKRDIEYVTDTDISIKIASKIRSLVKSASSKENKEEELLKAFDLIDISFKDQVMGVLNSYMGIK